MAATEYIVLFRGDAGSEGPEGYHPLASKYTAASAGAAVRAAAEFEAAAGSYIAIPARSWKPLVVTFENKPTVKAQS